MATTLEQQPQPTGTRKYVDFDEFIEYQVNRTRSGIKHTDLLQAGVTVALVLTGYLLAFVVLDHWVIPGGFSYVPRALMLGLVLAFVVGWTTWKIVLPYLKRITSLYAAKEIEQTRPELKSSLLTLVDLKRAGRRVQPHIVAAMEKRAAVNLSEMDVEQAVDRRPLMRLTYALFAVVVAMCLYTVFSPKSIASSLWRALAPTAGTAVSTRTRIDKVEPGDASVLARSQLEVTVDVSGEVPQEATLRFTTSDRSFVDEPVVMRDTGEGLKRFRGILTGPNGRGLLQDFVYHVEAGDARSDDYHVTVQQAPYATVEEVIYEYPAYMGLAARSQPGGEIDGWEGTKVTIRAVTNMPVTSGSILYSDTEDTTVKGREARLELKDSTHLEYTEKLQFLQDGTYEHFYRLQVRTEDGKTDPVPRLYSIKLRRDLPPQLKLLHPSGDVELPANGILPFAYEASDPDFMLRSVRAYFEKDELKLDAHTRHLYEAPPERSRVEGTDQIELSEFHLQPGETLTFWLEAWDNMEPLGAKLGNRVVTPKINITITEPVSPEQVQQKLDEQRQEAEQKLAEAQQAQNQPAGEEPGAEPASGEEPSRPDDATATEDTDSKPPQARDNPPETNDAQRNGDQNQNAGEPGQEGTAGAEQNPSAQPQPGERTQQPNPSSEGQPQATPDQTGGGERQPQPREGGEQRTQPGQRGSQQGEAQQPTPSDANDRAGEDTALQRLFQEYRDKIAQDRREQQQQQAGENNASQQDSSDPNAAERNSPDGESQSDGQRNDDNNSTSPESSPGTSPRDDRTSPSRSDTQRSPRETGSPNSAANPDRQPMTGQQSPTGETPENMPDAEGPGSTPGQPNSNTQPKPGETEGPGTSQSETNEGNDAEARPGDVPPNQGERRPGTRDQQNSGAKPTTGDKGERAPTAEPNKNASQTSEKPEGEPSGDPATQPSEKPSQEGSTRKPSDTGGSDKPGEAQPAPEKDPNQPSEPGDRGSSPGDPMQTERPPARTGNQPSGPDDSKPGEGHPKGQRSEQPSGGEQGSSQQASEGTKGGTQKGPGDASSQPGSQSTSPGQTGGKPGDKPGEGSQQQSGGNQPGGGQEGMPSEGQEGSGGGEQSPGEKPAGDQQGGGGKPGDQQGEKPSGGGQQGGDKPGESQSSGGEQGGGKEGGGDQGGGEQGGGEGGQQGGGEGGKEGGGGAQGGAAEQQGKTNGGTPSGRIARTGGGGGHDGGQAPTGEGGGGSGAADAAEEAELADKRRATELVLKRLEDELQRGEVSDEMLKDLGWTEDNLRDFMQRLEQRLADSGEDQSPEAQARRNQFQEILRGIDYSSEGQTRSGGTGPRNTASGFGAARRPAPAEFRRDQEAFKNRLSRETKGK